MPSDEIREPAEVFPLAQFIGDEMEARGWDASDVAFRMGWRDADEYGRFILYVELVLAIHDGPLLIDDDLFSRLAKAFGVSESFFRNLHETWTKYPDRRVAYEAPDVLFVPETFPHAE